MHAPSNPERVVAAAAGALLIGAIFGAFHEREPAGPRMASGTTVDIVEFQFGPSELSVAAGGTVTWTNQDGAAHTVRGEGTDAARSEELRKGDTYSFTYDEPGTYEYACTLHPFMHGTIVVVEG